MKGGFNMNQKRRHFSNKVVFFRGESIFKSRFSQAKTISLLRKLGMSPNKQKQQQLASKLKRCVQKRSSVQNQRSKTCFGYSPGLGCRQFPVPPIGFWLFWAWAFAKNSSRNGGTPTILAVHSDHMVLCPKTRWRALLETSVVSRRFRCCHRYRKEIDRCLYPVRPKLVGPYSYQCLLTTYSKENGVTRWKNDLLLMYKLADHVWKMEKQRWLGLIVRVCYVVSIPSWNDYPNSEAS